MLSITERRVPLRKGNVKDMPVSGKHLLYFLEVEGCIGMAGPWVAKTDS